MGALKSGLVAISLAGLFGAVAVVGCSADGSAGGIGDDTTPTEPAGDNGAALPPPSQDPGTGTSSGGTSSGGTTKKDGGTTQKDSGVDSGPPAPTPGTACTTLNQIFSRPCGKCGKQEAVCLADGDAGAGKWSDYGTCHDEVGECVPGETTTEACGNCGTQTKTCSKYCGWTTSTCMGQPMNSCKPGTIEYSTAGCTQPSTYRNRTCANTCVWSGFSATCTEPVNANKMTAKATVGGVATATWTLSASQQGKKPLDCGAGSGVSTSANYQYVGVEISNPTAQTATVSVYHSKAPGGQELDTLVWVYKKTIPPMSDSDLELCDYGVADSCSITGSPCGNVNSSLNFAGVEGVVIPPNGKILVYSSGYTSSVTGAFNLNVRTDSLM